MLSDTLYLDNLQEFVEDEKRIVSPELPTDQFIIYRRP